MVVGAIFGLASLLGNYIEARFIADSNRDLKICRPDAPTPTLAYLAVGASALLAIDALVVPAFTGGRTLHEMVGLDGHKGVRIAEYVGLAASQAYLAIKTASAVLDGME